MASFPKYHELICNTYTPDFTAGSTSCTLQSAPLVTKSRLVAGGSFFRSVKDGGTGNVNAIVLECILTPRGGSPDVDDGILRITNVDGTIQDVPFVQKYGGGSPHCIINGVDALRTALSGNTIVTMPLLDDVQPWDASTNDAACEMSAFGPTPMGGATVLPDATAAIRTGPAYSLFHVLQAETGDKGEITDVDAISEWDGTEWVAHPSPQYELDSDGNITPDPGC
jgi:hypothetical protein